MVPISCASSSPLLGPNFPSAVKDRAFCQAVTVGSTRFHPARDSASSSVATISAVSDNTFVTAGTDVVAVGNTVGVGLMSTSPGIGVPGTVVGTAVVDTGTGTGVGNAPNPGT